MSRDLGLAFNIAADFAKAVARCDEFRDVAGKYKVREGVRLGLGFGLVLVRCTVYNQGDHSPGKPGKVSGTHEDERTVLYRTKSLNGTKPNTNPNTNPNPKLTQILTLFSCFMFFSSTVP